MSRYQIAVLVGSIRRDSYNRNLAEALGKMLSPEFSSLLVRIDDLPLYNQDDDDDQADTVKRFKSAIEAAAGLLFVTPEHNRSISAALKNALDHGSRPYGRNSWRGKPAGVLGASPGAVGTAVAQQHLRNILACLDISAIGQPEAFIHVTEGFFDESGAVAAGSRKFLEKWTARYEAWVRQHVDR